MTEFKNYLIDKLKKKETNGGISQYIVSVVIQFIEESWDEWLDEELKNQHKEYYEELL